MNNRQEKLKTLVFVLILVFYGTLLFHTLNFQIQDLGRHLKTGEMIMHGNFGPINTNFYSYTEPNTTFINDHWLTGVVFYLLYPIIGINGLIIFKAFLLLFAFTVLFCIAMKKANFWLVSFFSIPTIFILLERTELRPEMFSYLFVVLFLYFLFDLEEHSERKRIFWLVLIQILWVNLHTFFIAGPILVGGFLVEKIILNFKNLKNTLIVKKLAFFLAILVTACFVNPFGISGVLRPFVRFNGPRVWVTDDLSLMQILNIKPVLDISVLFFIPLAVILLASFFFAFSEKRKPIFYGLASVGVILAGMGMTRLLPFFALIFLPAISENLNDVFVKLSNWFKKRWPRIENVFKNILIILLIATLSSLIYLGLQSQFFLKNYKFGLGFMPRSEDAANFFKEQGLHGPIFNDHAIGQYLIYNLFPQEKVFFDNRAADAYSSNFVFNVYEPMITQEDVWHEMLAKYDFNVIFFWNYDRLFQARDFLFRRIQDPDWALVFVNDNSTILLRNNSENQAIIKKFKITKENVADKIGYLLQSNDEDDQIAGADILNITDRADLALVAYRQIVLKNPKNSKVWLAMGEIEMTRNSANGFISASIDFKHAILAGQENARTYTFLGLAYFQSGQFKEAELALQKAIKIDPTLQDAIDYLNQLQQYLKP